MAQDFVNGPPTRGGVDEQDAHGRIQAVARPWRAFFSQIFSVAFALTQSGTTLERPTDGLWIGRVYFDETLGFPVWYNGTVWVNSAGTPV